MSKYSTLAGIRNQGVANLQKNTAEGRYQAANVLQYLKKLETFQLKQHIEYSMNNAITVTKNEIESYLLFKYIELNE